VSTRVLTPPESLLIADFDRRITPHMEIRRAIAIIITCR
jgi:hypothetical protein